MTHILESIALVRSYVEGLELAAFADAQEKQDAVVRRIEIMGEAVKNLPRDVRTAHPEVPWAQIAGMRDKVIHDYMGVDHELVWAVATRMLGSLRSQVRAILDDLGPPTGTA